MLSEGQSMKRTRISEWPRLNISLHPRTVEALEAEAEERGLSVSAIVRDTLDRAYRPEADLLTLLRQG
jgi:hypothetical protein